MNLFIRSIFFLIFFLFSLNNFAQVAQVNIPRIDQMPNEPSPYSMRDWKTVAMKYDSFVYDVTKTGQYLPIISIRNSGNNYPENKFFNMQTYVGGSMGGNEGINSLPSLVGASLVGIDKTNQYGQNWILMSQDFFNKKNGENLYLNGVNSGSGHDWWYDMMPNIFFFQLADLYPNIGGEKDIQFKLIADKMLQAVKVMGGGETPWSKPNMNYRAWNFKTMMPLAEGVKEPEAAGAFAYILYNAYIKTGDKEYLKGAEWSLEFLQDLNSNPSYELQLPYGTYTAARMNAELGTKYDVEKLVNWSFNRGPLRGWGTIVGKWGSFDVSGLVGEANDNGNDYAFQLNGVQQAAMLVPMVRYEKKFARAIGKWMVNLASATRLFYPGFLPAQLQDGAAWSNVNDPDRVIGHEALREKLNGNSPFSTGDAVKGGWAGTNLALYGTSSIGYMGAIIEKTNVDKILRLDLNKTDFYQKKFYPTYLYFNPYTSEKKVNLDVGAESINVYDAISESFILEGVSGAVEITIPANSPLIATITPAVGLESYNKNKFLINGIVADYDQTAKSYTYAPRIQSLAAEEDTVEFTKNTNVYLKVFDKDSDQFTYEWSSTSGSISGSGDMVVWNAPSVEGPADISVIVSDGNGNSDSLSIKVYAVGEINRAPEVVKIEASKNYVLPGESIDLNCIADDSNGDNLDYTWTANGGAFDNNKVENPSWTAPAAEGSYTLSVKVTDTGGLADNATITILVKEFAAEVGDLVAWYPFSGNGLDSTANDLDAVISGPLFTNDLNGKNKSALIFDGINDRVTVTAVPVLNFQDGITLSCWIKPGVLPERESFIVSHGSWQNRWKLSITPEGFPRWTVNTLNSIIDLDATQPMQKDDKYFLTATYDGKTMVMYVNGELVSFKNQTGKIRQSNIPMLIGQILPDDPQYNFAGLIDEVKIYNYALQPQTVKQNYLDASLSTDEEIAKLSGIKLFPNPGNSELNILFTNKLFSGEISILDISGRVYRRIKTSEINKLDLNVSELNSGIYLIKFTSKDAVAVEKWMKI